MNDHMVKILPFSLPVSSIVRQKQEHGATERKKQHEAYSLSFYVHIPRLSLVK